MKWEKREKAQMRLLSLKTDGSELIGGRLRSPFMKEICENGLQTKNFLRLLRLSLLKLALLQLKIWTR